MSPCRVVGSLRESMYRFLLFVFVVSFCQCNTDIINAKVERTVDIASQLVKITAKITLQNTGKSPVSSFVYALEPDTKHHLSYIGASQIQDDTKLHLKLEEITLPNNEDKTLYRIELKNVMVAGTAANIEVETILTHYLIPHPSHISQSEKQLVLYHGNHVFYSPYATRTQKTVVVLPSNSVESYSKNLKPVSQSENTITYGPYENVSPYVFNKMTVHCENNSPFLVVSQLYRAIEVSHWGIISVEETVDVSHSGATLKGPFSRYEFQRDQSGVSAVKSFKTVLPASATDVYYRDEIGNISTSHLRELDDSVEVELRPRFPLFGGWKTHYVLGYYVPTYEYLYNSGDLYVLKMRFVDHIFDDSIIDDATVKVILPEGSKNIRVKLPFPAVRGPDELHFTYLDTVGRPVIVFHKSNMVEQHIQDFEVHYEYQKILMLQEPLLVVVALYLLFIVVIIYVRLDFTLTKDSASEAKLRVAGFIEHVISHHDKRTEIYTLYDDALNKLKHSKDLAAYQQTIKQPNIDLKNETQAIGEILSKLKQDAPELADKVSDLQRADRMLREQLQQQTVLIEKLIAGKINKQQFRDAEATVVKKKEEVVEKMHGILQSF